MDLRLYEPHANQIKVHESKARYRVVIAGRRFGKSALGLNEAIARAFQLRNQIIWIVLPLFRQAKEIYWIDPDITKYFMPYIQNGLIKQDKSELSLHVLSTNSWIRLKGSDNYDSLRGSGIDLIIWDEVADVKEEAFETIKPALADSPNHRMLYIGTPKGLNWFHDFALYGDYRHIIPTYEKPIKQKEGWETWHFTSYDNMAWPENSYEKRMFVKYIDNERKDAEEKGKLGFFNQEYLASFEESAGRFFPKWTYKTHTCRPLLDIKADLPIYASIDWGRQAPFCFLLHTEIVVEWQNRKFRRIITFKEIYDTLKSPYEVAQMICKIIDVKRIRNIYYDPSMATPLSDGSLSVADQIQQDIEKISCFFPTMTAASNKRVSRWAAVDNWMRTAPDKFPYWLISTECKNLCRTIPLMIPDANNIEDLDTTLEDHPIDSAGYYLQYPKWIDGTLGAVLPKAEPEKKREFFADKPIPLNEWGQI